ncbi:MAG TPA: hypothetical protein PL059_09240 [Spirochaetota bacterium]|nr:hypothetical protein [Spirochaetota bacterium]HOM10188.1 hypothetical protein [Spirochaetota bacterium]HPP48788.1 hypothetical protein [Spirochaetota bacterium]HXK65467.1 hypothetical protein [Spirochaetota bacterium]
MQITISKNELYTMIKKAVKEVIYEERLDILLKSIPAISDEEMTEIKNLYGHKPPKRKAAKRITIDI